MTERNIANGLSIRIFQGHSVYPHGRLIIAASRAADGMTDLCICRP